MESGCISNTTRHAASKDIDTLASTRKVAWARHSSRYAVVVTPPP
jgi:hypothetical protein